MSAVRPIGRLPRVTLSGQIAETMRAAVLSGGFQPGAQMNEAELAQQFGVSRGPLREAMQRLIQEGLLISQPHRGVFVAALSEADLADIYFVREAIEGAAIHRVLPRPDRSVVYGQLCAQVERMAAAVAAADWVAVADSDFAFHRALVEAAESPRLSRMFETVQAETKLCLHLLMSGYRSSAELVAEHRRFADLVETGDSAAMLLELTRHFGDPIRTLRKVSTAQAAPLRSKAKSA